MVFIAEYDNKPIDASDITTKNKIKYTCLDQNCNNELNFIMKHTRTIKTGEITVSSHFAHINKTNNCNIENFLYSLGNMGDIKFYRKWTEPFIYNAIKNTFNNEYKFHVLYEDIMIMISNKINTKEIIINKENKCVNNEKITWILNCESRYNLNKDIIKRNYYDDMNNITNTKYYMTSSNSYYDLELYNMDKSNVYLDFGLNKLVKLVKKTYYTFQGWEIELKSIKNFLRNFDKILKDTYILPKYEKNKVIEYNIHQEIYDDMIHEINSMDHNLLLFRRGLKNVKHDRNKVIHEEYIRLKQKFGIDYCENIQDKIYINKKLGYSYNCLFFIWKINNDNFDKYYSKNIDCIKCLETISIEDLFNKNNICIDCKHKKNEIACRLKQLRFNKIREFKNEPIINQQLGREIMWLDEGNNRLKQIEELEKSKIKELEKSKLKELQKNVIRVYTCHKCKITNECTCNLPYESLCNLGNKYYCITCTLCNYCKK